MALKQNGLKKELKPRHITMISIGGIIGTSLFVGSGAVIHSAGPGALLSFILGGFIIFLVMRMLGEMSVVNPDSGSFATYAHEAFGPWASFTIGWLYWFFWVMIIAFEATISGSLLHGIIPGIPVWVFSLSCIILLALTNSYSVKSFGEIEYWFSFIKVITIVSFLGLGAAMIFGWIRGFRAPGMHNLIGNGGFFPHGFGSVFVTVVFVIFSISGTEVAAIAAGESDNPEKNVVKAINSVVFRILLFYIGSIFVIVTVLPWNSELINTPYASVFKVAGFPILAQIMNVIVIVAALSVLNSGIYTSSRMIFSLAQKQEAPSFFLKVNVRGVPILAILASIVVGIIFTLFKFMSPNKLFLFLANSSGGIYILVYLFISLSHIHLRKKREKESQGSLKVKVWLFPYLSYATVAILMGIYFGQAFISDMRSQFYLTSIFTVCVICSYYLFFRKKENMSENEERGAEVQL